MPTRGETNVATKHVAAAIIRGKDGVLAAERADGELDGFWEFPGGKVEQGETSEEALRREISEELGARLQLVWYLDTVEYDYPDFHLSMDCFVCSLAEGSVPHALEHSALRWLSPNDLLDVRWLPADEGLVRSIGTMWDQLFQAEHL